MCRIPSQIPPCNHLIHKTCFDDMVSNGHYACPTCGVSMMNMADVWKIYDQEIAETPMPEEYSDLLTSITCKDCSKQSLTPFHVLGEYKYYDHYHMLSFSVPNRVFRGLQLFLLKSKEVYMKIETIGYRPPDR